MKCVGARRRTIGNVFKSEVKEKGILIIRTLKVILIKANRAWPKKQYQLPSGRRGNSSTERIHRSACATHELASKDVFLALAFLIRSSLHF